MINIYYKWLKTFLVSKVRNIGSPITLKYIKFSDLMFFKFLKLDKFLTILLAFLLLTFSLILLLSILNVFETNILNNLVIFNI